MLYYLEVKDIFTKRNFRQKQFSLKTVFEEIFFFYDKYGSSNIGKGKNVVIDYSAPNIAKPFHIGHLRSTVIGGALYKIYNFLGYNSVGINYVGDWGLQFGKVMAGISLWKDEYDFENDALESLSRRRADRDLGAR